MLLVRCGDEAFELSEANELRAVAYRIALAIENGLLHKRMTDQLAQLHRLQELTAVLAGTLELDAVGQRVADTLVSEAAVSASAVLLDRGGQLVVLSSAGSARALGIAADGDGARELDERWETFPLEVAGKTLGIVAVTEAPETGSEQHQLLLHLVSLGALSLDKALLHEQSRDQARHDSLTGLLGHRVFHEVLEHQVAAARPFSVLMFDIDDFKQINDLHGHQTGDHALRLVSDALRQATRSGDSVFRIGGEEFCVLLPGLAEEDALTVAEAVRRRVAGIVSTLPNPVTVSVGVACFPGHGRARDELLASADAALYSAKRSGKNRSSMAGVSSSLGLATSRREVGLDLLHKKDADTVEHSVHVAILAWRSHAHSASTTACSTTCAWRHGCTTSASSGCPTPFSTRPARSMPMSSGSSRRTPWSAPSCSRAGGSLAPRRSSCSTTSGSTARAIPPGSAVTRSASRAASSTPPTPTSQ